MRTLSIDLPIEKREVSRGNYKEIAEIISRETTMDSTTPSWARKPFAQNVWVYSCVDYIVQTYCQIPLGLWQRKKGGNIRSRRRGFREVEDHPVIDLLDQPNELMDQETFLEAWATYLLTGGNVWIQKGAPNSLGIPRELFVWGIQNVSPEMDQKTGELLFWKLKIGNNKYVPIPLEEMIHTRLPNPYHPYMGLSPTSCLAAQLDADYARTVFDKAFFKNNASPDAVLLYKLGPLSDDQRSQIRKSWHEFHGGPDKAGGLAVIGGDFDFKVWGVSHSQSQFLENRQFTREEVASAFKIPVILLNAITRGGLTKESMKAANRHFYENAVFPLCNKFKKAVNRSIIKPAFPQYLLDFNIDLLPIMSDYLSDKAEVFDKLVGRGVPINEAIAMLDLDMEPIEGGEKGYLPGNFIPVDILAQIDSPPQPGGNEGVGVVDDTGGNPENKPRRSEHKVTSRGVKFVVSNLENKIKGFFEELRKEAIQKESLENPFDLTKAQRKWVRKVLPTLAFALQSGLVEDSDRSIFDHLSEIGQEETDRILHKFQIGAERLSFKNADAEKELTNLVAGSTEIISLAWRNISDGSDPRDIFSKNKKTAHYLAERLINRAIAAGKQVSSVAPQLE